MGLQQQSVAKIFYWENYSTDIEGSQFSTTAAKQGSALPGHCLTSTNRPLNIIDYRLDYTLYITVKSSEFIKMGTSLICRVTVYWWLYFRKNSRSVKTQLNIHEILYSWFFTNFNWQKQLIIFIPYYSRLFNSSFLTTKCHFTWHNNSVSTAVSHREEC